MIRLAAAAASALAACGLAAAAGTADVFSYRAVLSAKAEVPKPAAPAGAGGVFVSTVTKDGNAYSLAWKLTFKKLSGPAVAAHIHRGKLGVAGGVIVSLCGPCKSGQTGEATIPKAAATAMRSGGAYVNVHTAKNSAGEIRAQLKLTKSVLGQPGPPPSSDPTPPPPPSNDPPPPPDY
jgi:hypothetical protein